MSESPLFSKLKSEGKTSTNPLKESFRHKANFKMVLMALFGAVMGQGVVWYTGQFYAQSFLENSCKLEFEQSRTIMLWAIAFATPFFVFWGWLSDKIGRKWIMMAGMFLAILTYRPIFNTFLEDTKVYEKNQKSNPRPNKTTVSLINNGKDSVVTTTQFDYFFAGVEYDQVSSDTLYADKTKLTGHSQITPLNKRLGLGLYVKFISLVFLLILYVTMVYGPIAAFLVEMFPTKIRYTSMSLPYHIGNGVFGGLVPFIGLLLTTSFPSDPLVGLWYPIGIAALCLLIGTVYLRNKIDENVED
jgi:MFS family permease